MPSRGEVGQLFSWAAAWGMDRESREEKQGLGYEVFAVDQVGDDGGWDKESGGGDGGT